MINAINDLEQYGRRQMVEIAWIPRTSEKDVEDTVINLFQKLNLSVCKSEIEAAHRLSAKYNANIIIKFTNRKM